MKLVDSVKGSERYKTIKLLADRITDELTAEQIETIVESGGYLNQARILLRQSSDRT